MEEDFLKEKCFQFGVSLLLPLCFPRVKTEGVKLGFVLNFSV